MTAANSKVRPRPAILRALGGREPPPQLEIDGQHYNLAEMLKHDSWAATAIYQDAAGQRIVCKFHRQQSLLGMPMRWLGRQLARRESHFLWQLADVSGIPRLLGPVSIDGRKLPYAVARQYVAGHPLGSQERVTDDFFSKLLALLSRLHERNMAYVDLHKRENVIVGDDGQPYLIDFQISHQMRMRIPGAEWLARGILRMLQATDFFNLRKLHVRCRPDQVRCAGGRVALRPPWWIALHRIVAVPFRTLRRRLLVLLGVRSGRGMAQSELFAEDALRQRFLTPGH